MLLHEREAFFGEFASDSGLHHVIPLPGEVWIFNWISEVIFLVEDKPTEGHERLLAVH